MECRRSLAILTACAILFFLYFNIHSLHLAGLQHLNSHASSFLSPASRAAYEYGAANSTLGFAGIIAVSKDGSLRRDSLIHSANLTGLDITIPHQPTWTDADVATVKSQNASIISRGSAMAWLGHLNALKWFVESGLSSALIIEDDVDWDIHLRHHQVPLVASALRKLLNTTSQNKDDPYASLRHHDNPQTFWGDLSQWELLYLGHCGDYFNMKYWPELPHQIFMDESLLPLERMHPETEDFLRDVGLHNKQRMVHKSKKPLCSFAYGVTRASAIRILAEFSTEEENHGTWAYDVRLLEACRDLNYKCWSSTPELFHHMDEHSSEITEVNGKPLFPLHAKTGDGSTPNIGCGARSEGFKTKDKQVMEYIRHMAAEPGLCLMNTLKIDGSKPG